MNEQEKEINLKRLFYKALKNWRKAAIIAIVGAVVLGGTKCAVELAKISDPEVLAERQTKYLGELALYQQEGDQILKAIDTLETSLVQQEEYNEKSVLMEIDPYDEWRGSIDFYVETDWQIMPELSYQNQNVANQIVRVYSMYISNGELYQYILERFNPDMEIRYLNEILTGTADANNFLIHFTVRGGSREECQTLLNLIEEGMKAKQADILESVGEFKLLTTNNTTYTQVNYELEQAQKNNLQLITDMNTSLSARKFELMEWELREEEIEMPVIEKSDAIKAGVKMVILAGFILGMGTLVLFGITYIVSKFVQDREEFDGWGCFVAELPKENKKRAFWWIDRIIGKWFLENVNVNEYDARLAAATKYIGESVRLLCDTAQPKVVLVSDIPKKELEKVAEAMSAMKMTEGVQFAVAGNPLLEAEAIDTMLSGDAVILVVRQEYSKKKTVFQIKEQMKELQKLSVAVLLLDADAVM